MAEIKNDWKKLKTRKKERRRERRERRKTNFYSCGISDLSTDEKSNERKKIPQKGENLFF